MSKTAEFIVFVGVAFLAHVALWIGVERTGSEAAGATGTASISLLASAGDVAKMVDDWNRPIEAMEKMPIVQETPDVVQLTALQQPPSPVLAAPHRSEVRALPLSTRNLAPETPSLIDTESPKLERPDRAPDTSRRPPRRPRADEREAAKPSKSVAPAKPQKAAGNQAGDNAGRAVSQQSASLSNSQRQSLLAQWGASIRNGVERRKRYPAGTNASGTVILRIAVARDGRLAGVSVIKTSGDGELDQAAVRAVRKASYPAAPKGLSEPQYRFNLPVAFSK